MATVSTVKEPPIRTLMAVSSRQELKNTEKVPRRKPVYPISAERELARDFLSISVIIRKTAKPYLQRIAAVYGAWADENVRTDARLSMQDAVGIILEEYGDAIDDQIDVDAVTKRVNRTARYARKISINDWKTLVKNAVDLEIDEPFYMETTEDLVNKWTYESVQYITRYPQEYLGKIQEVISWGYTTNQPLVNVYRRLEKVTGDTRAHVRMVARDLMGTLNCRMTQYEHESMGVSRYRWVTKHDSRVRECHRLLDGHIFDWNNPPAQWYSTMSRGIVYTGYGHPGEAYGCRCVAAPVFDEKLIGEASSMPFFK